MWRSWFLVISSWWWHVAHIRSLWAPALANRCRGHFLHSISTAYCHFLSKKKKSWGCPKTSKFWVFPSLISELVWVLKPAWPWSDLQFIFWSFHRVVIHSSLVGHPSLLLICHTLEVWLHSVVCGYRVAVRHHVLASWWRGGWHCHHTCVATGAWSRHLSVATDFYRFVQLPDAHWRLRSR